MHCTVFLPSILNRKVCQHTQTERKELRHVCSGPDHRSREDMERQQMALLEDVGQRLRGVHDRLQAANHLRDHLTTQKEDLLKRHLQERFLTFVVFFRQGTLHMQQQEVCVCTCTREERY